MDLYQPNKENDETAAISGTKFCCAVTIFDTRTVLLRINGGFTQRRRISVTKCVSNCHTSDALENIFLKEIKNFTLCVQTALNLMEYIFVRKSYLLFFSDLIFLIHL